MDEGKPTKAKWWSRPRPDTADAAEAGGPGGADASAWETSSGERAVRSGEAPDQDGPVAGDSLDAMTGVRGPDGPGPEPVDAAEAAARARRADAPRDGVQQPQGVPERPRPLHDPDPYGTPPYGEPGPWAPAPPVQHPGMTPAHGTQLPPIPPAPGTTHHGASVPGVTPPQGTPFPGATPPGAAGMPPGAGPAQGTPAGTTPYPAAVPAYGMAPPGGVPPQTPPYPVAPAGYDDGALPPGHGVPAAGAAFHGGTPAGGVPMPPTAPGAAGPYGGPLTGGAEHGAPYGGAYEGEPQGRPFAGDWGRPTDPWAAPLHQNGAAPPRPGSRRRRLVTAVVIVGLVAGGLGGAAGSYAERQDGTTDVELPQSDGGAGALKPDSVAGIAKRALPSVVTLHVRGSNEADTGTGFVLDDKGHILTNNHVIQPATSQGEISVTFNDGKTADAKIVGHDSGYDLAVVQVSGVSGLKPLPLGNSNNVAVGDPVVAIGAPFDLAGTVTSGIISAKERPITAGGEGGDSSDVSYVDALQTDAPINPGNSGGPLVDVKGRVIGINSAIRSAGGDGSDGSQGGSIGLGFAIPINQAKRVAEELIDTGTASHPVLGVTLDMGYTGDGARVADKGAKGGPAVTHGGPGDKAGIGAGDVITAVDGTAVHSGDELIVKIRSHRPGDKLKLTVQRGGAGGPREKVTLVLGGAKGN